MGHARRDGLVVRAKKPKKKRGPFMLGDFVVSHSGAVHGVIISDFGEDIRVREHGPQGGTVVGKRRYWHHDPDGGEER
jgi:hypothetical protein